MKIPRIAGVSAGIFTRILEIPTSTNRIVRAKASREFGFLELFYQSVLSSISLAEGFEQLFQICLQ